MDSSNSAYIYRHGTSVNTSSVISSKVKVYAVPSGSQGGTPRTQVGVIASFDPSESRSAEPVRGIGFGDQVAEVVPGVTEPMSISVSRAAQYLSNIYQAFGYKGGVDGLVRSLKHHRWPFDVQKEVVISYLELDSKAGKTLNNVNGTDDNFYDAQSAILTIYEACWFTDYSTSFSSDTAIVQEQCTLMCSDVTDGTNLVYNGKDNADTGNWQNAERTVSGGNG